VPADVREAGGWVGSHRPKRLRDAALDLVFVHLPVPHEPVIYDAARGRFRLEPGGSYADNLALADRALAHLRDQLARAGLWERSWVLVSSDHGWREGPGPDRHVPFLLKAPGAGRHLAYERKLDTVASARLLTEILRGRIGTISEAALWLERSESDPALPSVAAR
jgi:hypothetical protein